MKRGTLRHMKTKRLARELGVPVMVVAGLLEALWHFTAEQAIRGDIGRWRDEEIADEIGWTETAKHFPDAPPLIATLVACEFLDRNDTYRLLIHDWPSHADQSVQKTLKNRGLTFALASDSPSSATAPEPLRNDSGNDPPERVEDVRPAQGKATAKAQAEATAPETAEAESHTARAREAETLEPEFLAAAHARFPHLHGRQQIVAYAWATAKSSGPPSNLELLDHLRHVSLAKILAHLATFFATIEARFHSLRRFVETFGDHDPDAPSSQLVGARGQPLRGSMGAIARVGQDLGVIP